MKRALAAVISFGAFVAPPIARSQDVAIVGPLSDGTELENPEPADAREFEIRETVVQQLADRKVTIHRVKNPGSRIQSEAEPQQENVAEQGAPNVQALHELLIAATVVDNSATFLRWWHNGQAYQAWSNVNFNYLTGFTEFRVGEKHYTPVIAVSKGSSAGSGDPNLQSIPAELLQAQPGFVLMQGDSTNAAATEVVAGLHEMY